MDTQTALKNIDELILGENSIPVQLRNKEGLDKKRFHTLIDSIETLIETYKNSDNVPKRLALAFVDITNYFYFNDHYYSEKEQEELEDAAHQLSELANQLFDQS